MHEHNFRRTHAIGEWHPSEINGVLRAHDEWFNYCDCGEKKKIRTHPRGIWKKATEKKLEQFFTYPAKWQQLLRSILQRRLGDNNVRELSFTAESALKTSGLSWSDIEKWIMGLLHSGIAELFEPYPQNDRGRIKLYIRVEDVISLQEMFGLNEKEKEREQINSFFGDWEYPHEEINGRALDIVAIIDRSKDRWQLTGKPEVWDKKSEPMIMKSVSNYRLLMETLREIFDITCRGELISFRDLAVRATGNSKGLETLKSYLKSLLGNIADYGIIEHSPFLLCRIPVIGEIDGKRIDFAAADDYVSITSSTANRVDFISSELKYLLMIENLTPFEKISKELSRIKAKEIGVIFLSGYPPGHVREFLKKIVSLGPEGSVWCDLDPDGVEIALTVTKLFPEGKCRPVMMEPAFLSNSQTKLLEEQDIQKISHLQSRVFGTLADLLDMMARKGTKVEQEAQNVTPQQILTEISTVVHN
ncbi:MAG: DUF2220 family protein [Nitrospiraceae bacterium]|nr:DUF2220 family protein [Nitrospiraceae bacterium]